MLVVFGTLTKVFPIKDVGESTVKNFTIMSSHISKSGDEHRKLYHCALWDKDIEMEVGQAAAIRGWVRAEAYTNTLGAARASLQVTVQGIVVGVAAE